MAKHPKGGGSQRARAGRAAEVKDGPGNTVRSLGLHPHAPIAGHHADSDRRRSAGRAKPALKRQKKMRVGL